MRPKLPRQFPQMRLDILGSRVDLEVLGSVRRALTGGPPAPLADIEESERRLMALRPTLQPIVDDLAARMREKHPEHIVARVLRRELPGFCCKPLFHLHLAVVDRDRCMQWLDGVDRLRVDLERAAA